MIDIKKDTEPNLDLKLLKKLDKNTTSSKQSDLALQFNHPQNLEFKS